MGICVGVVLAVLLSLAAAARRQRCNSIVVTFVQRAPPADDGCQGFLWSLLHKVCWGYGMVSGAACRSMSCCRSQLYGRQAGYAARHVCWQHPCGGRHDTVTACCLCDAQPSHAVLCCRTHATGSCSTLIGWPVSNWPTCIVQSTVAAAVGWRGEVVVGSGPGMRILHDGAQARRTHVLVSPELCDPATRQPWLPGWTGGSRGGPSCEHPSMSDQREREAHWPQDVPVFSQGISRPHSHPAHFTTQTSVDSCCATLYTPAV